MDEEVIRKFDAREVDASNFYEKEENSPQKTV
jgi:hypothetical protein